MKNKMIVIIWQFQSVVYSVIYFFLHFSKIQFSNTSIKPARYDVMKGRQ